nr:unnamed protein product [Callosobruchus analis]
MHDATVFQKSFIRDKIMKLGNRYHIIGDAAYPISENLLSPYRDYGNMTPIQENYNYKFSKTRVLIENGFGLLKGRFRQLMKTESWGVEKTSKFALCCCIVHNLCIDNDNQAPPDVPLYTEELDILRKQLGEITRSSFDVEGWLLSFKFSEFDFIPFVALESEEGSYIPVFYKPRPPGIIVQTSPAKCTDTFAKFVNSSNNGECATQASMGLQEPPKHQLYPWEPSELELQVYRS